MNEMTLLTKDQVSGLNKLEIFKNYGFRSAITDFAILLGGQFEYCIYSSEGASLKNRIGKYWTKTNDEVGGVHYCGIMGSCYCTRPRSREISIRPVLPYQNIKHLITYPLTSEINIAEFGEYPMWVASRETSELLESRFLNGSLKKTHSFYTTDSTPYFNFDESFKFKYHIEYEYEGQKYIRFIGDINGYGKKLSNGQNIDLDKPYWIKVEPVKWLIDEKEKLLISKDCLLAGIRFDKRSDYEGNFVDTYLKQYLNDYFSRELTQNCKKIDIDNLHEKSSFDDLSKTEQIMKMLSVLLETEDTIEKRYIEEKNNIVMLRDYLNTLLDQTNEITDNQMAEAKRMIRKLDK